MYTIFFEKVVFLTPARIRVKNVSFSEYFAYTLNQWPHGLSSQPTQLAYNISHKLLRPSQFLEKFM